MVFMRNVINMARGNPLLTLVLAGSFFLNSFYFTFPTWNPDYLVDDAFRILSPFQWDHKAFFYGSWHINFIKIFLAWPAYIITQIIPSIDHFNLTLYMARLVAGLMGAVCVYFMFAITRFIAGNRSGLFAAFFLTINPLLVNLAHFATGDVPSMFYGIGSLFFFCHHIQNPQRRIYFILSAIFVGLTISTKYVGFVFFACAPFYYLLAVLRKEHSVGESLRQTVKFGLIVALTFAITSFQMLLFHESVKEGLGVLQDFNTRFAKTHPIGIVALPGLMARAMGAGFFYASLLSIFPVLYLFRKSTSLLVVFSVLLAHVAFFGIIHYYPTRYVLPFMPLLCVYPAIMLAWIWETAAVHKGLQRLLLVIMIIGAGELLLRAMSVSLSFPTETRLRAGQYLEETLKPGDFVAFNKSWFLYYPELPPGVQVFNLGQEPPKDFDFLGALVKGKVNYIITSSFLNEPTQNWMEKKLYVMLEAGQTPYGLLREFQAEKILFHQPRTVEFLNPVIRIYSLKEDTVGKEY